jgi:hypothetical protein
MYLGNLVKFLLLYFFFYFFMSPKFACILLFLNLLINLQHYGPSPLPAYEPAFDWENERSMIFGQRISEAPLSQYGLLFYFFSGRKSTAVLKSFYGVDSAYLLLSFYF